jgi:hypothetical protein
LVQVLCFSSLYFSLSDLFSVSSDFITSYLLSLRALAEVATVQVAADLAEVEDGAAAVAASVVVALQEIGNA